MKYLKISLFLLSILISGESLRCQDRSVSINNRDLVNIEYVKMKLLEPININFNSYRSPDSIWIIKLEIENLYLTQSYYGSGNNIIINLIWFDSVSYKIIDSLFCFWADDLFSPLNITYNDKLNWFTYTSEGSGTNHYSETKHFIRIENNRFQNLFDLPNYISDINPVETPWTYTSLKTTEIELTQKTIVIKARFESGIIKNDESKPLIIKEDIATFEYSDSCKCFIWRKSTNNDFENFWKGEKDFSWL